MRRIDVALPDIPAVRTTRRKLRRIRPIRFKLYYGQNASRERAGLEALYIAFIAVAGLLLIWAIPASLGIQIAFTWRESWDIRRPFMPTGSA